jgi:hypothetical protein
VVLAVPTIHGAIEHADEQISGLALKMSQAHAASKAEEIILPDETLTPKAIAPLDHAAILGIEGKDLPAFAETPVTKAEAIAAGFLRADPERKPRRARVKAKEPHESSAILWHKECAFGGGERTSKKAYHQSYVPWCRERNLTPLETRAFGEGLGNLKLPSRAFLPGSASAPAPPRSTLLQH